MGNNEEIIMEMQVMYLVNAINEDGTMIGVRTVVRTIDPKLIFGDDLPEIGQVQSFFIRLPWNPDNAIEYHPVPTRMGF
jgi:hypothetical protein